MPEAVLGLNRQINCLVNRTDPRHGHNGHHLFGPHQAVFIGNFGYDEADPVDIHLHADLGEDCGGALPDPGPVDDARLVGWAERLAHMAYQETGLGRPEDKIVKNRLVAAKTPGPEDLEPEAVTGDTGMMVTEWAPFGVIGAITPTTNPTSTIINNTISVISAGNACVFNVHPNAKKVSAENIRLLNRAIVSAGGPPNLITAIPTPTIASAQELMHHPDVRVLLVTGGPAVPPHAGWESGRGRCG